MVKVSPVVLGITTTYNKVSGLQNIFDGVVAGEVFLYDLLLCKRTDNYRVAWGLIQWHHGSANQHSVSVILQSG